MLGAALLLLGYVLSNYLLFINKAVADVPIQSPLLLAHRIRCYSILQLPIPNPCLPHPPFLDPFRRRTQEVHQTNQELVQGHLLLGEGGAIEKSGGPHGFGRFGTVDGANPEHIELPMANTTDQPTPLFGMATSWTRTASPGCLGCQ